MAGEPTITIIGNLAGDPELRFTTSGIAVVNFTIAQTPRTFDRNSQQWQDDETLWVRCTAWREYAENIAETLAKGMRVIAFGRLNARSFETKEGEQRTNWELTVEEVGPALRWATASVQRVQRNNGAAANTSQWGAQPAQGGSFGQPAAQPGPGQQHDPWAGGQPAGTPMHDAFSQSDGPPPF